MLCRGKEMATVADQTAVRGLFETHLTVSDLERSLGFYCDIVGLPVALEIPERNVAFFMKQMSARTPDEGKALIPPELMIREFPIGKAA